MLLSVYDSLDYTNQYYEHLLNNNEINTSVKQQLLKNYPFLRKSFVYSIVDELKTINSKMRQYFEMKRNLLRSNEFNRRNYKTNPYLSALKKYANFKKRPIIFKKLNYTFPIAIMYSYQNKYCLLPMNRLTRQKYLIPLKKLILITTSYTSLFKVKLSLN